MFLILECPLIPLYKVQQRFSSTFMGHSDSTKFVRDNICVETFLLGYGNFWMIVFLSNTCFVLFNKKVMVLYSFVKWRGIPPKL